MVKRVRARATTTPGGQGGMALDTGGRGGGGDGVTGGAGKSLSVEGTGSRYDYYRWPRLYRAGRIAEKVSPERLYIGPVRGGRRGGVRGGGVSVSVWPVCAAGGMMQRSEPVLHARTHSSSGMCPYNAVRITIASCNLYSYAYLRGVLKYYVIIGTFAVQRI